MCLFQKEANLRIKGSRARGSLDSENSFIFVGFTLELQKDPPKLGQVLGQAQKKKMRKMSWAF